MWCVCCVCCVWCVCVAYGGPRDADAVAKQLVLRGVEPLICASADWMRSGLGQMVVEGSISTEEVEGEEEEVEAKVDAEPEHLPLVANQVLNLLRQPTTL